MKPGKKLKKSTRITSTYSYKGNRILNHGKFWGGTLFFRIGYDQGHPQEHFKLFCEVLDGGEQYGITRFMKFCHYVGIL